MKKKKGDLLDKINAQIEQMKKDNPNMTEEELTELNNLAQSLGKIQETRHPLAFLRSSLTQFVFSFLVYLAFMGFSYNGIVAEEQMYFFFYALALAFLQVFFRIIADKLCARFGHPLFLYIMFILLLFISLVVANKYLTVFTFVSNWWIIFFVFGTEIFNLIWQYTIMKRRFLK